MHVLMKGSGRLSAGRAVKKIRRLSAGGEIALTGSFRGTSTSVPLLSREEAMSWLSGLEGVVLYLHDDVTFGQSDIDALRVAHTASGVLTTAGLARNEATADHPVIVGAPAMLADLLGRNQVTDPAKPAIERIEGVTLEHSGSCTAPAERPLLVASMIVRDEEDQIAECLQSLEGLVDRVEIVDTGSIDETIAIARSWGAHVSSAEWSDDFAAARNLALDQARDARFVLHIDADERAKTADADSFREALHATSLRAIRVPMRNVVDGRATSEFEAVRVFSTDDATWVGRVHEYPADVNGTPLPSGHLPGIAIDHFGYHPDVVVAKDKWNRNVALAEAAYASDPSFKTRMDLARSLAWCSDEERAFAMFREAASDLTGAGNQAVAFVVAHVALAHLAEGDLGGAHELAAEALEYCSGEYVAHLARARAWKAQGNDAAIIDAHRKRSNEELDPPMFDTAATRHITDNVTVGALARLGNHVEAMELAVSVLDLDPARFDEWKSLATMPEGMRRAGLPLLVSMDTTGRFLDALVGEVPMPELAALVLAHVEAQEHPSSHTVVTGVMAAVISKDEPTATRIAELGVAVLDSEQRAATAERCTLRGATSVASILDPLPV